MTADLSDKLPSGTLESLHRFLSGNVAELAHALSLVQAKHIWVEFYLWKKGAMTICIEIKR